MTFWDRAPLQVRLNPELVDGRSVVARLNESDGVAAHIVGDILVIRPSGQPMVASLPANYNGRPEFRGTLSPEGQGPAILKGFVDRSSMPLMLIVLGGVLAVFGAAFGAAVLLSGDPSGVIALVLMPLIGAGLFVGAVLIGRLSAEDEKSIMVAIRSIANEESWPAVAE